MNKITLFSFILLIFTLACEKKDKEEPIQNSTILIYTNAQALLNCGPFDVSVSIDNDEIGILKNPFLYPDSLPDCSIEYSSDDLLKIEVDTSTHIIRVNMDCQPDFYLSDTFCIEEPGCYPFFIDLEAMFWQLDEVFNQTV